MSVESFHPEALYANLTSANTRAILLAHYRYVKQLLGFAVVGRRSAYRLASFAEPFSSN